MLATISWRFMGEYIWAGDFIPFESCGEVMAWPLSGYVSICYHPEKETAGGGEHWELMIVRYGLAVIAVGRAEIDVYRKVPS